MTDLRKAAEMALEILDMCFYDEDDELFCLGGWHQEKFTDAREALRQALAQEQEPVAWMKPHPKCDAGCLYVCTEGFTKFPTCCQPEREWVGLTDEEVGGIYREGWTNNMDFARAIEAKLKEKNT